MTLVSLTRTLGLLSFSTLLAAPILRAQTTGFTMTPDVAYGTDPKEVMDIYQPPSTTPLPVIVMIHGGGWIGGGKGNLSKIAAFYAQNGYVVANINYRLSAPGVNQFSAAIDDVSSAINWIQTNAATYGIDPTKVAAFGASAGGYLAVEAAQTGEVNALVDFYGPVDLTDPAFLADTFDGQTNASIMQTYLGASITDNPSIYSQASPINYLSAGDPPAIIFHGQLDNVVPVTQAETLAATLTADGVSAQLVVLPTAGHGFLTNRDFDSSAYLAQALAFLNTTFGLSSVVPDTVRK